MDSATETLHAALIEAINDEYRARARYAAAIEKFGPIRPFSNIVGAEGRHVEALIPLFDAYGLPVPPDNWAGRVAVPDSVAETCQLGIDGEIHNYQMYDRLMARVADPQAQAVFARLRSASHDRHLVAFQTCVARETGRSGAAAGVVGGVDEPRPANRWSFALGLALGSALVWALSRRGRDA